MRVGLITFLVIASIILTSNQIQPAFAQSFFDDFTNIFINLQSYFDDIFNNSQNNGQNIDVFRALGETISDWTDDFDEEKKLLKEQKIQNEIELEKRKKELEQRERQLQTETLAKEQKQRELEDRQRLLDAERLAKEQKQRELEQKQRELEQKQRELEERQRQLEAERLAKEQKQRELEQRQRLLEAEKIQSQKRDVLAKYSWSPFVMGLTDGELTFYVQQLPSYVTQDVRNQVESLASWMDGANVYGGIKLKRVYQNGMADFSINWVRDYQQEAIGRQVGDYLIVGLGKSNCYGQWMPFDGYSVYKIMWHEVGHALGYAHVSDSNNIMYEHGTGTNFNLAQEHTMTLPDGYWRTIPLCYGGSLFFSTNSDNQNGHKVYVVPSDKNPRDIINGNQPYYTTCSAYENAMISFSQNCTVEHGSYILIENPSRLGLGKAITVDVKIFDTNSDKRLDLNLDESHMYFSQDFVNNVRTLFRN